MVAKRSIVPYIIECDVKESEAHIKISKTEARRRNLVRVRELSDDSNCRASNASELGASD